jgi:serine/threonine protein kinase
MHSLDVVHGDLKTVRVQRALFTSSWSHRSPQENVLVDSQGRARLTDFGLATILIATATMATAGRGTIRYMAPELLDYEEFNSTGQPTKKSDVYALAITVWRVCVSSRVYHQGN